MVSPDILCTASSGNESWYDPDVYAESRAGYQEVYRDVVSAYLILLFVLGPNSVMLSGVTPGSPHRNYTWWGLGFQRLNLIGRVQGR